MPNLVGRPPDPIAEAWALRFDLCPLIQYRMTDELMDQLSCCKSDECRRLILGISEQYHDGEGPLLTDALMVL